MKLINGEYIEEEDTIEIIEIEPILEELKAKLDGTDYKVIKCYEYQLTGLELPYDIVELHAERQTIREQINALESV
jgi:hypothetical protein